MEQFDLSAGPAWSWHEEDNGIVRASPLIDGDRNVYISSVRGRVYKFTADGALVWKYDAHSSIPEMPALYDGCIFVTNADGNVLALDTETGVPRWSVKVGNRSAGDTWSMTAGEGTVVAALSQTGEVNERLVALNAKDGSLRWSFAPTVPVYNVLPSIYDGSLVFTDPAGAPYRLSLVDGSIIWRNGPAGSKKVDYSPSTGGAVIGPDGVVYVTSNTGGNWRDGHVTAFNFTNGALLWRANTEYQANNVPAVGRLGPNGKLAVVVGVGENPDMPDWNLQLFTHEKPEKEKRGRVVALDAETGLMLWSHDLPLWHGWAAGDWAVPEHVCLPISSASPVLAGDGTAYVGFQDGRLYAIKDKDGNGLIEGTEVSSFDAGNAFQGSPGIAPGMLVASPCNGLHVFRSKAQAQ